MTPAASSSGVLAAYPGLVCDIDGVVLRGGAPVPGAGETLWGFVRRGGRVAYATNNSSRRVDDTRAMIADRGAPTQGQAVLTSAIAGAAALTGRVPAGGRVLALGGPGVTEALGQRGYDPVPPGDAEHTGAAVLQGLGPRLTVDDFAIAARWLTEGAEWVATNADATLPVEWGEAPGNGAYVQLLAGPTGRMPRVVGKPAPDLYELCLAALELPTGRVLGVGDRLETDIAGARAAGIDSALVLTGVSRPADVVRLERPARPTHVADSLADLTRAVPEVRADGRRRTCGTSSVALSDGDGIVVEPGAHPSDLVRAALALADAAPGRQDDIATAVAHATERRPA